LPACRAGLLYQLEFAGEYDNRIKKYKSWQETTHAVLPDDNKLYDQRINYTHENPVGTQIVFHAEDYLWSSARDYSGEKGYVNILPVK
jgi:putative transposase